MKIQYASDLHLEFIQNKGYLNKNPIKPIGDIMLLAGDNLILSELHRYSDFFNYLSENFKYSYFVPGNHEYYDSETDAAFKVENIKIRKNVFLVNNISIIHGDIKFIFTTLWSKISEANRWNVERSVNDYHLIRYKGKKLSVPACNELHEECLAFLKKELSGNENYKTVVVTHHVPTLINYPQQYIGSAINDAFAVDLTDLIESTEPDIWIYGHSHVNTPDFKIGKTLLTTNQMGYVMHNEHNTFNNEQIIKL